jgi:hypothetical protein
MDKILIITNKKDTHPTSVINLLIEKNISYFRLNTEAMMTDYDFVWKCKTGGEIEFEIKDRTNGKRLLGKEIHSIWYRRPLEPNEFLYHINEEIDKHNAEESKRFYLYLMYFFRDIYSVGNHFYDKYANSKLVQLKTAIELGMKVPDTCLSNTKTGICNFSQKFDEVILKPLHNFNVLCDDVYSYVLFTIKMNPKDFVNQPEESFTQTVCFCENYVTKKYEVRVTIMGSYIFSCKLDSQSQDDNTGKIDWRQGYDYNLKHELINIPEEIEDFCRKYLRKLNLRFGCFDFIVTPENEYVFLECNPNGQWVWIEEELNIPMSEAMVDCLVYKLEV